MTSKLVVNTIEADTGISSVSFASSISMSSTSKFFFSDAGINIGADTNINRPASGVLGFNSNGSEKFRVASSGQIGLSGANYGTSGQVLTSQGSGNAATWSTINSDKISEGNTEAEVVDTGSDGHFKVTTEGSERLRIQSDGKVNIGNTGSSWVGPLSIGSGASGQGQVLQIYSNSDTYGAIFFGDTTSGAGRYVGDISYYHDNNFMRFSTAGSERLRIDSNGFLGIDNASPVSSFVSARNLVIGTASGNHGMTIMSGTNNSGHIEFSDGTGSDAAKTAGGIRYYHDSDYMRFNTGGGTERVRIDSSGRVLIGTTTVGDSTADNLTIADSGTCGITIRSGTSGEGNIFFSDGTSGAATYAGTIQYKHADDALVFHVAVSERLRIASNGDFGFNDTAPTAHASGNNTVLSIKGKGSSYSGKIDFKDSDGNIDSYINSDNSILQFYADPNSQNGNTLMRFYVHGAERFRFGAAGQFGIGTNYGTAGQVLKSGGASAAPTWGSAGGETTEIYAYVSFGTTYDTNSGYVTQDVSSLQSGNGITVDNSNERLTPTVAGKYFVMYMCNWLWSFSGGATFYNRITKNGSEQQRSTFSKYDPGSHTNITMCVMTMNGSSDYVQFQGYENKSGQAAYMGNLSRAVMFKLRD